MTKQEKVGIRTLFTRRKPEASNIPTVEEAIAAWEADKERNPDAYKILRGIDGKPVEITYDGNDGKTVFAITVNGKKELFQMGFLMKSIGKVFGDLEFRQFITDDVFNGWYEIKGVQRLEAQVGRYHQGFVFGILGPKPDRMKVANG